MKNASFSLPLQTAFFYSIVAGLWIIFSDRILIMLVADAETLSILQTYKGLFFVTVTALLLLLVLRSRLRSLEQERNARMEAEQKEKEYQYQNTHILENVSDAFVSLDNNWCYTYMNKKAGEIFHRDPASMIGKHIWTEFPEGVGQVFYHAYRQAMEDQQFRYLEEYYPPYDRWFENRIYPSPNGLTIFFHDITERKKGEEKIRANEERLRLLVEYSGEAILLTAPDGRILSANPTACRLFGRSEEELCAAGRDGVVDRTDPRLAPAIELRNRTGIFNGVLNFVRKDGTVFSAAVISTTFKDSGGNICSSLIIREMTDIEKVNVSLKEAKETAEHNEKLLRLFVEHAPASIAMFDRSMKYMVVSRRYLEDYRLGLIDIIGRSHYEIFPELPERWKEIHARCLNGAVASAEDDSFLRSDGTLEWVRWEIHPWHESSGGVGGIILFSEVITERKKLEQEINEGRKMLDAALVSMTDAVCISDNQGKFIHRNEAFAAFHKFQNSADCVHSTQALAEYVDVAFPDGTPAPVDQWSIPRALRGESAADVKYILRRKDTGERWVGSFSFSPVRNKEGVIVGSVTVGRDITEQQEAAERIRLNEERLRLSLTAANHGLFDIDFPSGETVVNREYAAMLGYDPDTFRESYQAWIDRLHPDDRERVKNAYQNYLNGIVDDYAVEFRQRTASGEWRWFFSTGKIVEKDAQGKPLRMLGINTDTTDKKRTEDKLRTSDRIFQHSLDMLCIAGFDGYFKVVNPAWEHTLGWSSEELLSKPWVEFIHPDDVEPTKNVTLKMVDGQKVFQFENRYFCKDGSVRWLSWNSYPYPDENIIVGVARDITDKKKRDEDLLYSKLLLQNIIDNSPSLIYVFNVDGTLSLMNSPFAALFDRPAETMIGYERSRFMPDEIAAQHRKNDLQVIETKRPMNFEEENIETDGRHVYFTQKFPLTGPDGKVFGVGGISTDITERKRADEKLRASEERFRSTLDNMLEGAQILGFDWNYLYINKAAEQHNRRPSAELMGYRYMDVWPGIDTTEVFAVIKRCMEERLAQHMENEFTYPDGVKGWFDLSIQPIPEGVFILSVDITERKLAADALIKSEEKYRNIIEHSPYAIFINQNNTITYVNSACVRLLGASEKKEILGKKPLELFHPDYHEMIKERIRVMEEGSRPAPMMEEKIVRMDGSTVDVETDAVPFMLGNERAIHVMMYDITERKKNVGRIKEQLTELKRWHDATLGREKRILELKKEVNGLMNELGRPLRYSSVEDEGERHG